MKDKVEKKSRSIILLAVIFYIILPNFGIIHFPPPLILPIKLVILPIKLVILI